MKTQHYGCLKREFNNDHIAEHVIGVGGNFIRPYSYMKNNRQSMLAMREKNHYFPWMNLLIHYQTSNDHL